LIEGLREEIKRDSFMRRSDLEEHLVRISTVKGFGCKRKEKLG